MSYQKILDRQKALRDETLQISLKNSETAAIANKDLDNGVIQMVQDTRSRYEIEQDKQEQENMAFTNIKKLFKNDAQEIAKSIKYLKSNSQLMLIFNKYYGQIYKDLDGIYNLIYKDFKNYFERFYDKITTTQGVDRPAQVGDIANLQQGITDLQQQQELANEEIYQNFQNITTASKALKRNMNNVDEIIAKYYKTRNVDLYNEILSMGVDENFMKNAPIELNDPNITDEREKQISDVLRKFTRPKTKEILGKYPDTDTMQPIDENALQNQIVAQPTGLNTFERSGKIFRDGGDYAFLIDNGMQQQLPYLKKVGENLNGTSKWNKMSPADLSDYLADTLMTTGDVAAPIKNKIKNSSKYPDGSTLTYYKKTYIRRGDNGYEIDASGVENTVPSMYFDADGKPKKGTNPAYIPPPPPAVVIPTPPASPPPTTTTPTIAGVGLKKSINTDKVMKILKKLQMKKITGGTIHKDMKQIRFINKTAQDKYKSKGGSIQQDMSKVKIIKQMIKPHRK